MPNWCSNEVIFHGDEKKIKVMYDFIEIAYGSFKDLVNEDDAWQDRRPDNSWIGYMALLFGATVSGKAYHNGKFVDKPNNEIFSRGFLVTEPELSEDGKEIHISIDSAWAPLTELWYFLANRCGVEVDFVAEEPGFEIYVNTDISGTYFRDRYHYYEEEYGDIYYESELEFLEDFNDLTEKDAKSFAEAKEITKGLVNISIHEFTTE